MIPRVHSELLLEEGGAVPLDDEQHHYLRNVLRRVEGDEVRLFNAREGEFDGKIELLTKKAAIVRLKARRSISSCRRRRSSASPPYCRC
jgi:16S rRNA (uracil1498-N3)-methyltransferase